jgi:hypothetical protein
MLSVLSRGQVTMRTGPEEPANQAPIVTKDYRRRVTAFPLEKLDYFDLNLEIWGVIEGVTRGFRRAVIEKEPGLYRPWTLKNSRWDGSLWLLNFPWAARTSGGEPLNFVNFSSMKAAS